MKIDVAVPSYKKTESLLYTLMTLKSVAGNLIDTVYINDDFSNDGSVELYQDPQVIEYFKPWKLNVRSNSRNVYIKPVYVRGYRPDYMNFKFMLTKWWRFFNPKLLHQREDVRYQFALDHTDKKYLFIIHDDVKFVKNIVELYLNTIQKNSNLAIVGDLGQCWRCKFSGLCSPKQLMKGFRPSKHWPLTPVDDDLSSFNPKKAFTRACRINEWCCMVDVAKCKDVTERKRCFFGNMYKNSDTAAFWFGKMVECGYDFADPLASDALPDQLSPCPEHEEYYIHAWQGHTGHSVWADQGTGITAYNKQEVIDLIKSQFGFDCPEKKARGNDDK